MRYFEDCPTDDDYSEVAFLRDQLAEAREEIEACYALLGECKDRIETCYSSTEFDATCAHHRDVGLVRRIEARLLPAAKGSALCR